MSGLLQLIKILGPAVQAAWPYIQAILKILQDAKQGNVVGAAPISPQDKEGMVADLMTAGATEQEARDALP